MSRVVLGLGLLVVLGGAAAYVGAAWPAQGAGTQRFEESVVGLRAGRAYAYVVERGDALVLVDTGSERGGETLLAELSRRGRSAADVDAVLVTHAHRDHYAAAALFPNAVVYIGEADQVLLRGDRLPEGVIQKLLTRLTEKPALPARVRVVLPGERLLFGELRFDVLATPGHTPGSVMYLYEDRVLFSGDALLLDGDAVRLPPWFLSDDVGAARRSLGRLASIHPVALADGHVGIAPDADRRLRTLVQE